MPPAARLGDRSHAPADSHGCSKCPHDAIGPATLGSSSVYINDRSSIRVGDSGTHSSCCDKNSWVALTGSRSVFINGAAAHRKHDKDRHCGGDGEMIEGSHNVYIGDKTSELFDQGFILYYEGTKIPAGNRKYRLVASSGRIIEGRTDEKGRTRRYVSHINEQIKLELIDS